MSALTWVILLWLARNIERFCDSWMDWGSAIFRRNWAALEHRERAPQQEGPGTVSLSWAAWNPAPSLLKGIPSLRSVSPDYHSRLSG